MSSKDDQERSKFIFNLFYLSLSFGFNKIKPKVVDKIMLACRSKNLDILFKREYYEQKLSQQQVSISDLTSISLQYWIKKLWGKTVNEERNNPTSQKKPRGLKNVVTGPGQRRGQKGGSGGLNMRFRILGPHILQI